MPATSSALTGKSAGSPGIAVATILITGLVVPEGELTLLFLLWGTLGGSRPVRALNLVLAVVKPPPLLACV